MTTRQTLLMLALLVATATARAAEDKPEQVVHRLLAAPHGAHASSGKEHALRLERVRNEPGLYIPLLVAELQLDNLEKDLGNPQRRMRARIAAGLLADECGELGREALQDLLPQWQQARDDREAWLNAQRAKAPEKPDPKWMDLLRGELRLLEGFAALEQAALLAMLPSKDARFRELLLGRLPAEPHLAMTYVDHLIQVAPGDGDVDSVLAELMDTTEDPMLRRRIYGYLKNGPPK